MYTAGMGMVSCRQLGQELRNRGRSVHIAEVDGGVRETTGQPHQGGSQRRRVHTAAVEFLDREPADPRLPEVWDRPGGGRPTIAERAPKHELDLVGVAIMLGELVVTSDVLPDKQELPDLDVGPDLLTALPAQGLGEGLPSLLAPARKQIEQAVRIPIHRDEEFPFSDDDRLRRNADRSRLGPHDGRQVYPRCPRAASLVTIGPEVVTMRLSGYHFGRIKVDDTLYHHDLIVLPTEVREWRRREGHRVHPEDLDPALAEPPQVFIVGTGFSGLLQITTEATRLLRERGIELIAVKTGEAVEAYNDISPTKRACALLHLTC